MKTLLLLISVLPSLAFAAVKLKSESGEVSFLAVGKPSMLKIHGKAADPEAKLIVNGSLLSGITEIAMEKFTTGIGLRDKHMKEKYLQTAENPKATLTLKDVKVDPAFAETLNAAGQPFEGTLNFHGKEKPVKGTFAVEGGKLDAKFPLTLSDFGVEVPQYLGVTVAENVDVNVSLSLKKE